MAWINMFFVLGASAFAGYGYVLPKTCDTLIRKVLVFADGYDSASADAMNEVKLGTPTITNTVAIEHGTRDTLRVPVRTPNLQGYVTVTTSNNGCVTDQIEVKSKF